MRTFLHSQARVRGTTLVELMMSSGVGTIILAGLIAAAVALKTTYNACDEYYKAMADQSRVLDNVSMDLRRATSGSVSNSGQTLRLVLTDYIDYTASPAAPKTPTVSGSGTVTYGSGNPVVVYTITGTSPNQSITRTYTPVTGAATVSTLNASTQDFNFLCVNPTNGSSADFSFGAAGQPSSVTASMTFKTRYNQLALGSSRTATTASITTVLRNHK